ncbi:MAG: DNA-protecting protein DprA, partial [Pseudomonadota bacterium]
LIRDGATLVRNAADVLEALAPIAPRMEPELPLAPPPTPPKDSRTRAETTALHQLILDRLGPAPLAEDQLIRDLGTGADKVAPVLLDLELEGAIDRAPGGLLSRAS